MYTKMLSIRQLRNKININIVLKPVANEQKVYRNSEVSEKWSFNIYFFYSCILHMQSHQYFFSKAVLTYLYLDGCMLEIFSKLFIKIFAECIFSLAGGDIFLSSYIPLAPRDTYFQSWKMK